MPQVGQILSWPNYSFPDGKVGDKLFIVINESSSSADPCLILITTSQTKWYLNCRHGCNYNHGAFYIPVEWKECLKKPTFVKLPLIIEISCFDLWAKCADNTVVFLQHKLSDGCMTNLKSCLKLFAKDILPKHYSLLFQ